HRPRPHRPRRLDPAPRGGRRRAAAARARLGRQPRRELPPSHTPGNPRDHHRPPAGRSRPSRRSAARDHPDHLRHLHRVANPPMMTIYAAAACPSRAPPTPLTSGDGGRVRSSGKPAPVRTADMSGVSPEPASTDALLNFGFDQLIVLMSYLPELI